MRKVMADADVIMARRQLQICQQALIETQRNLHTCIDQTQRERSLAINGLKKAPAEVRALVSWQQRTVGLLAGVGAQKSKLQETEVHMKTSEKTLETSQRRRRQIELRQFKYEELIRQLCDSN
jgi:hypothetical protein